MACVLIILLVSTSGCSSLSTMSVPAIKQDTSGEKSLVELPAVPDQYVAQPAITPKTGLDPVPTPTLQERLPPVDSSQGTATSGTGTSGSGSDITVNSSVQATTTTTTIPTVEPTNVPTTIPTNVPTVGPTTVPTILPTISPTPGPITVPTTIPTIVPTIIPSAEPTTVPTGVPTSQPTTIPTTIPTLVPTTVPIIEPTTPPTPTPSNQPVKLIFIHHSSGENWLADSNGGLGLALKNNNFFVSDTNYGWGIPSGSGTIGDYTDIGDWWTWFRGPQSATIMNTVYSESGQHASYSRISTDPGGKNQIIMFKSCFPNSGLSGTINDPIPSIENNPLKGQSADSPYHTISNAKGIYIDLLNYFQQHQDTLFVVVTAPPLSSSTYSANARALNLWLVNDWLKNYPTKNVAVFDFYNVLTTNAGSPSVNDAGRATGNHHRIVNGIIQHQYDGAHDTAAYASASDDDHPDKAGNQKATTEFLPYLQYVYNTWKAG